MMNANDEFEREFPEMLNPLRYEPQRDPVRAASGREGFLAEAGTLASEAVSMGAKSRHSQQKQKTWFEELFLMNKQIVIVGLLLVLAIGFTMIFGGVFVTSAAAQASLPGDALYPIKTGIEEAQIAISRDAAYDAQLNLAFAEKRLDEMANLIAEGRYGDLEAASAQFEHHVQEAIQSLAIVAAGDPQEAQALALAIMQALSRNVRILADFVQDVPLGSQAALQKAIQASEQAVQHSEVKVKGYVDRINDDAWVVDGLTIQITPDTFIEPGIKIGDFVEVKAFVGLDDGLVALEIELEDDDQENGNDNGIGNEIDDMGNENDDLGDDNENDDMGNENDDLGDDNENDDLGDDNENDGMDNENDDPGHDNENDGMGNENDDLGDGNENDDPSDGNENDNAGEDNDNEVGGDDNNNNNEGSDEDNENGDSSSSAAGEEDADRGGDGGDDGDDDGEDDRSGSSGDDNGDDGDDSDGGDDNSNDNG